MRWTAWTIAVVVLGAAFLAACGDDDDAGGATAAPTATRAATVAATATASPSPAGNRPPVASFTMVPSCTTSSSTEVTLTSTSTDPDGDELSYAWDIRSGTPSTATGPVVTGVTFPNVAPYEITLTVDDGNGGADSAGMIMGPC